MPPAAAPDPETLARAVAAHDRAVAALGIEIWIGGEPTFTDRFAETPEWLFEALGPDKEARAERLVAHLARERPGAALLRTVGRQYDGESRPRWSLGVYARRDGVAVWAGPPDPCLAATPGGGGDAALDRLWAHLPDALAAVGWSAVAFRVDAPAARRVAVRLDGAKPCSDVAAAPALARGSVHDEPTPPAGLADPLAEAGLLLLVLDAAPLAPGGEPVASVELPEVRDPAAYFALLDAIGRAARAAGLPCLVLRGHPPPVDARVAWSTVTPDPAVIEVNDAPAPDAARFHAATRALHEAATAVGLAPYRLRYEGSVADSGGAGHLTLGGPTPAASPFFVAPALLPRLVRYGIRHPSLSYWLAHAFVGPAGQSPRADEGLPASLDELELALALLARTPDADAERIAAALQPFLVDVSGNPHRSQLNIEKLWNARLPRRGRLGLVELRAFRMARSPAEAVALACLVRAIAALLIGHDPAPTLHRHGDALHDRFALPFFLRRDLEAVLDDLAGAGLGLEPPLPALLLDEGVRSLGAVEHEGCRLELRQAVEFWPLVGDVSSQERGSARLVDASTTRIEVRLRPAPGTGPRPSLDRLALGACGVRVPLRPEQDAGGALRLLGIRYRTFLPYQALHPAVSPIDPLRLSLGVPGGDAWLELALHAWRPDGGHYPGLPASEEEAAARRAERCVATRHAGPLPPLAEPPPDAVRPFTLDLRRALPDGPVRAGAGGV